MKKFALVALTTAIIGFGGASASAQAPDPDPDPTASIPADRSVECSESDGRTDENGDGIADECVDFYIDAVVPTPPATTAAPAKPAASGFIPKTGAEASGLLGVGSALLVGGGLLVVTTRRRRTATPAH